MPGKAGRAPVMAHQRGVRGQAPTRDQTKRCGAVKPARFLEKDHRELGQIWDDNIAHCHWLLRADTAKAIMWCYMWRDWWKDPSKVGVERTNSLRALGSELGMDPLSKTRLTRQYMPVRNYDRYKNAQKRRKRIERLQASGQATPDVQPQAIDVEEPGDFTRYQ